MSIQTQYKIAKYPHCHYFDSLEEAKAFCEQLNCSAIIECPNGVWLSYWSSDEDIGNQQWHCARYN